MKTIRTQTLFASFVVAICSSQYLTRTGRRPAWNSREQRKIPGRVEVIFIKWVTDLPNMAGLVSGDAGGGPFAGEILNSSHTNDVYKIEALYHINGEDSTLPRTTIYSKTT